MRQVYFHFYPLPLWIYPFPVYAIFFYLFVNFGIVLVYGCACLRARSVCVCGGGQVIYQNFGQGNIAPKIINFVGVYRPAFDNYIVSCSIIFPMR